MFPLTAMKARKLQPGTLNMAQSYSRTRSWGRYLDL